MVDNNSQTVLFQRVQGVLYLRAQGLLRGGFWDPNIDYFDQISKLSLIKR